jgi:membrane protease YdiL (CAAX protease family)
LGKGRLEQNSMGALDTSGVGVRQGSSPQARRKAIAGLLAISVILSVHFYREVFSPPILNELFLYLLVPLLVILLVFRENPMRYGLALGRWREGLAWIAGGMLLMAVTAWLFSRLPEFRAFYPDYWAAHDPGGGAAYGWRSAGLSGLQMFAWEFLFRGFLLFALADLFGPYAIWIQAVPFTLAHFGKPEWETYSSIVGGVLSGWVAYRVGSFYPSWLIHWALAVVLGLLLGGAG